MPQTHDPAPASHKLIRSDLELAYQCYGPPEGAALVLCHGLAMSGRQFASDAAFFAGRGMRVLVPDLRGHGASQVPDRPKQEDFAMAELAADVLAMLDTQTMAQVTWVGNSMGGLVGLEMLRLAPARFARIITFGTTYELHTGAVTASFLGGLYQLLGATLVAKIASWAGSRQPSVRALLFQIMRDFDLLSTRSLLANLRTYDYLDTAGNYSGQISLIRAGLDDEINRALTSTIDHLGDRDSFTLHELAHAGHFANLDCPAQFRETVLTCLSS